MQRPGHFPSSGMNLSEASSWVQARSGGKEWTPLSAQVLGNRSHSCPRATTERKIWRTHEPQHSCSFLPLLNSAVLFPFSLKEGTQKGPQDQPKCPCAAWPGPRHRGHSSQGTAGCPGCLGAPPPGCPACLPASQRTAVQYASPCLLCAPYSYFLDTNHTKFQHLETAK